MSVLCCFWLEISWSKLSTSTPWKVTIWSMERGFSGKIRWFWGFAHKKTEMVNVNTDWLLVLHTLPVQLYSGQLVALMPKASACSGLSGAPSSRAWLCVAKLIGLETSGNICTRGCVFHCASSCMCVFVFDVPRLMTFWRSSTCSAYLTNTYHTWHMFVYSCFRGRWNFDDYHPRNVSILVSLKRNNSWLSVLYE